MNSNASARSIRFQLAISADEFLAFYQGVAKDVMVRSGNNRTIKFPANAIREFLTHDGIYGHFEIQFDSNNKLIKVIRLNLS